MSTTLPSPASDELTNQPNNEKKVRWQDTWHLIKPFWVSEEKWKAGGLLLAIILLALGGVYLNVLFNTWNRDFYNALETKNYIAFKAQLWRFSYLAFIFIAVAIYKVYLQQALEMRWRTWLTKEYMGKWLAHQTYYRMEQTNLSDNPDQRIAEDLKLFTKGTLDLSLGLLSSTVTLVSFIGILWIVSGPLSFMVLGHQMTIPGYMVWFAIAYAFIGSLIVWITGKKLIQQNFNQQKFEADFRFGLIRIREYSETIALYGGEAEEKLNLESRFEKIRHNWWAIMRTTKRLNLASYFYAQFAIIFPMLVGAPRYFSGAITLGGLTQISSAFGQVQDALSWFVNAFSSQDDSSLAKWKASVNRLASFHTSIVSSENQAQNASLNVSRTGSSSIKLNNVSLHLPNQSVQPLLGNFSVEIEAGQRLLISGPSGSGKSTLFRAIAGIWPYGDGTIEIPRASKILFLPQRTYLPIGTLRDAIAYPSAAEKFSDEAMVKYLTLFKLEHLCDKLNDAENWGQRLSTGEQQRLAFIRLLLIKPDVVFLDEATSAVDEDMEELLYSLLVQELPKSS
ncbi:MAG: ABC transporter ATP-binding protein/permease, partial [Methylophilaceae bacterium]